MGGAGLEALERKPDIVAVMFGSGRGEGRGVETGVIVSEASAERGGNDMRRSSSCCCDEWVERSAE